MDETTPLNPRGLLVAYEEQARVLPVASDFDAFLIGSSNLRYPPVPSEQLPYVHSLIRNVESILASPSSRTWTHRWIEVLKRVDRPGDTTAAPTHGVQQARTGIGLFGGGFREMNIQAGAPKPKAAKHTTFAVKAKDKSSTGDAKGKPKNVGKRATISGTFGKARVDGRWGFGDELSRSMIRAACSGLKGAVRHAAESFNYYWPQVTPIPSHAAKRA